MTLEDTITGLGRSMLRLGAVAGVRYVVDPHIPLTRWDEKKKRNVDVACVQIGDALHFHPDRWGQLNWVRSGQSLDLARWADDGGRA